MQDLKKLYRMDYEGEHVVTDLVYQNAEWAATKEWIPNGVTNVYTTSQALIIGGGKSWQEGQFAFDMSHIQRHKGGLFGTNRLQTYGTNLTYTKYESDFLVVDDDCADQLANSGYCRENIVYAHAQMILKYPGSFYLIPQDPNWNAGTIAAYLACFDGHKKVFMMGFDGKPGEDVFYEKAMSRLFGLYPDVDFVRVSPTAGYYMPEAWKYNVNLRQITFRDFVIEADLG